jgi:predicted nucleic acid-binding protein
MTAAARGMVIDASVALSWCFEDETSPMTDAVLERLRHEAAVVPVIWPLEMANGLRSAERRGRIDAESILAATRLLMTLPIQTEEAISIEAALGRVLQIARSLILTSYDAAYIDLATRRGLPLATADDRLVAAARAAGLELVEATDAN